MVNRQS